MSAPRKTWGQLSPAYRKRLQRQGINSRNYRSKSATVRRQAARGHASTPEHPERAVKAPEKFADYLRRHSDLAAQVAARKEQLFGDRIKYKPSRSLANVTLNPRTHRATDPRLMRRFLRMTADDVDLVDWSDDDWAFLFYH